MNSAAVQRRSTIAIAAVLGVVSLATVGLLAVLPAAAAAVPVAAMVAYGIWALPLKHTMTAYLFLCLLLEGLGTPLGGVWESPFKLPSDLFFVNLNLITGIGALRLPVIDMMVLALYVVSSFRQGRGELTSRTPSVRALNIALLVQFVTIISLDLWGTFTGGNFNESLWQLRQMLLFPLRAVLVVRAYDGSTRELVMMARLLVVVAFIKSLVGSYFLRFVATPQGLDPEFTTSHHDTLIFVPVLLLAFHLLLEDFQWKRVMSLLWWLPVVVLGMLDNDRRLAWVSLGGAVLASFAMSPLTRFKRFLVRVGIVTAPLMLVYFIVGWSQTSPIFAGAQLFKSLIVGNSEQTIDYRDMENFNVLFTWSQNPAMPLGFGHMFINAVQLPDISSAMPTWQYHPHNQWLWMFTIGGPIGFSLMYMPFMLTIFLAGRVYRRGGPVTDRVAALTIIGIMISCLNQMFGDMGTLGFTLPVMASIAVGMTSKMAVRTGAWPASRPARRRASEPELSSPPAQWSPSPGGVTSP